MIQWRQADQYHLRSVCGRFTISRTTGGPDIAYTAWRVRPKQVGEMLACHACDAADGQARDAILRVLKDVCEGQAGA